MLLHLFYGLSAAGMGRWEGLGGLWGCGGLIVLRCVKALIISALLVLVA